MPGFKLTEIDNEIILEMYKAHYSAREVAERLHFSYSTIIPMFRLYRLMDIKKKSRIKLLEATNDD